MSILAEPLTRSVLFRLPLAQLRLIQEAAEQLAEQQGANEETQSLLEQVVRLCLHAPALVRDLWEWSQHQEQVGRLRDRVAAGKELRDQLCDWLDLFDMLDARARASAAAGYPIPGAELLLDTADQMAAIARDVNQAWSLEELPPAASIGLSYEELRRLADRPPASGEWPDEDFDRS
jgi:hypothetical protein